MVVAQRLLTAEEYMALPDPGHTRYELVKGELVDVSFATAAHSWITGTIYQLIFAFVRQHGLGYVFSDGTGYITTRNPDSVRGPDVSFVAHGRLPGGGIPDGPWPFAPDLAVEVLSPGDRAGKVREKVEEYLAGGSRLVWVLRPRRRSVTVHAADGTTREFGADDELEGGEVLPGFRVHVAELFALPT
jgi:Uma2 family endonuclease